MQTEASKLWNERSDQIWERMKSRYPNGRFSVRCSGIRTTRKYDSVDNIQWGLFWCGMERARYPRDRVKTLVSSFMWLQCERLRPRPSNFLDHIEEVDEWGNTFETYTVQYRAGMPEKFYYFNGYSIRPLTYGMRKRSELVDTYYHGGHIHYDCAEKAISYAEKKGMPGHMIQDFKDKLKKIGNPCVYPDNSFNHPIRNAPASRKGFPKL